MIKTKFIIEFVYRFLLFGIASIFFLLLNISIKISSYKDFNSSIISLSNTFFCIFAITILVILDIIIKK